MHRNIVADYHYEVVDTVVVSIVHLSLNLAYSCAEGEIERQQLNELSTDSSFAGLLSGQRNNNRYLSWLDVAFRL